MKMTPEKLRELVSARVANMCLMDDAFFCAVFDGDLECTQYVLRIIMGIDNLVVRSAVVQKPKTNLHGRGVRFDVLAEADGVYYDIEVQRTDEGATPRRARFYSSSLDTHLLDKGAGFEKLPETYIIFITEHDVLKRGLAIYHIERRIVETAECFKDGAHIIYVNGTNREDTELGRLMRDFAAREIEQMQYSVLRRRAKYFKQNKLGVSDVSDLLREILGDELEELLEDARESALMERQTEQIHKMLRLKLPVNLIAQIAECSVEEIRAIAEADELNNTGGE